MRWFRQRKEQPVNESGLDEARRARLDAELRLEVTEREVTIPLRDMHRVNHIQPLINQIILGARNKGDQRD